MDDGLEHFFGCIGVCLVLQLDNEGTCIYYTWWSSYWIWIGIFWQQRALCSWKLFIQIDQYLIKFKWFAVKKGFLLGFQGNLDFIVG